MKVENISLEDFELVAFTPKRGRRKTELTEALNAMKVGDCARFRFETPKDVERKYQSMRVYSIRHNAAFQVIRDIGELCVYVRRIKD